MYDSSNSTNRRLAISVFTTALIAAVMQIYGTLDFALIDGHSFRQSQTAISAYYLKLEPTRFINYQTPVFGSPWQTPFEVPIYQWVCAQTSTLTGWNLDFTGRFVSLFAWAACIGLFYCLAIKLKVHSVVALCTSAILVLNPFYLYWGRTFLMETTALAFGLGALLCVVQFQAKRSVLMLIGSVVLATLCGLQKATTWVPIAGFTIMLWVYLDGALKNPLKVPWKSWGALTLMVGVPFITTLGWTKYTENLRAANPIAQPLVSGPKLHQWNYGTMEQLFSLTTWERIWEYYSVGLLTPLTGIICLGIIVVGIILPTRLPVLMCVATLVSGPIIFTNLFFEHSYYWIPAYIWLFLALAFTMSNITSHSRQLQLVVIFGTSLLLLSQWKAGQPRFMEIKKFPKEAQDALLQPFRALPKDRPIVFIGWDWSAFPAYYGEVKGIFIPSGMEDRQATQKVALAEPVKPRLVSKNMEALTPAELSQRQALIKTLNLKETRQLPFGTLYE